VRSSEAHGTRFTATIPVLVPRCGGAADAGTDADADAAPPNGAGDGSRTPTPSSTPPMSRVSSSSDNCLLDDDAARARLAADKFGADDGITPFLPPHVPLSQSFEELKRAGQLPQMLDLVRARPRCAVLCCVCVHAAILTDAHVTTIDGCFCGRGTQLLANSTEGFVAGTDTSFTVVSPGFMNIMRYEDKGELLRTPPLDLIHPDDLPQALATWRAAQAASASAGGAAVPTAFMCRQRRRDGSYVWAESASCITPTHFYGLIRDVNDRKALEASLKEFLTSTMADMRQPLAALAAASQLLAAQPCVREDEEAAFLAAAIASAARMLDGIVANVLSLRSLEAGDCAIDAAPFSVRDMLGGVLAVCRMSLAPRDGSSGGGGGGGSGGGGGGASITWLDEQAPLPPLVIGDGDRLAQCVLNLLTSACVRARERERGRASTMRFSFLFCAAHRLTDLSVRFPFLRCAADAVKFADNTPITVSARCEPAAAAAAAAASSSGAADAAAGAPSCGLDAMLLTLSVADGGRGMSAEECERAFEPYFRAPTHKGGGTGLGA
jgi:signal transduction histidine kinase